MQSVGCEEKEGEKKTDRADYNADGRQSSQKENVKAVGDGVEAREEIKLSGSETYRGKLLPAGMKVKKRISAEESSKAGGEDKEAVRIQDKAEKKSTKEEEAEVTVSTPDVVVDANHSEKMRPVCPDLKASLPQKATDCQTSSVSRSEPVAEKSAAKCAPRNSSRSSSEAETHRDEDDDVVLVSVKPATQKTPPASAVQKTITSFPGFQSAKAQLADPGLLRAQLQQKKVGGYS